MKRTVPRDSDTLVIQKPHFKAWNNISFASARQVSTASGCKSMKTNLARPSCFIASWTVKLLLVFSMDFVTNSASLFDQ